MADTPTNQQHQSSSFLVRGSFKDVCKSQNEPPTLGDCCVQLRKEKKRMLLSFTTFLQQKKILKFNQWRSVGCNDIRVDKEAGMRETIYPVL